MDNKRLQELAGVKEPETELQKALNENMFQGGYGHEKSQPEQVVAELAQMLRDIKVFIRDGNMEDAAMMVDRAYSRAAGAKRGE
jgi:hypothetical protein